MSEIIEKIQSVADLPVGLVDDEQAFQDFLVAKVKEGEMLPSTAIKLYCEVEDIPFDTLVEFADTCLYFGIYDAVLSELDTADEEGDVVEEYFDFLVNIYGPPR